MQESHTATDSNLRETAPKPDGGFYPVPANTLLAAWWAYRAKIIPLRDLRVWLASLELISRRCGLEANRKPRYRIEEIQALVGSQNDRSIRQSVKRLVGIGLLNRSGLRLTVPRSPTSLESATETPFGDLLRQVPNRQRIVPVPRRLLRFLAGTRRAALIGTAFGHLLRCLYYRNGECISGGRCKASWIADVFELDVRTVKAARKNLLSMDWLVPLDATQCELNRWGMSVRVNLTWSPGSVTRKHESPPPRDAFCTGSPPPIRNKKLSSRVKNQKPAPRGPAGACTQNAPGNPPDLRRVAREDLTDPARLDELRRQAVRKRWISSTACDRLRFFGAAERAKRVGERNPCGLFVALIRDGRWAFISQSDEDRAVCALKQLDKFVVVNQAPTPAPNDRKSNSERLLRRSCA